MKTSVKIALAVFALILASNAPLNAQSSKAKSPQEVRNAYPELDVLEFERTKVEMNEVLEYIKGTKFSKEVKISCYAIFKNESANGTMGINNNYIGYQADGRRVHEEWTKYFSGTVVRNELMTGKPRRFFAFHTWQGCVDILLMRIKERGLYVGGYAREYAKRTIETDDQWPEAYYQEWVLGDGSAKVPDDKVKYYSRAYQKAKELF